MASLSRAPTEGNVRYTGHSTNARAAKINLGDGKFDAFDAASGKELWHFACGAGVNAPPITYSVDGKQYVAVAAGGSAIWGYPQGDALIVFALPE